MEEILSDRGFVFYSWNGCNRLEKYLETEGIHQTHARPHHLQTVGKVEATNKQVQKKLLRRQHFDRVDGKEFTVTLGAESETAEEAIKVLEMHRQAWGSPLAVVTDHDSANLAYSTLERSPRILFEYQP